MLAGYPSHIFLAGIEKYANLLIDYSISLQEGDELLINGPTASLPLIREMYKLALLRGAFPTVILEDAVIQELFYRHASQKHLERVPPIVEFLYEKYNVHVTIYAPEHTRLLAGVDPEKQALRRKVFRHLTEKFLREAAEGKKRWTLAPFPTLAMAQEANMSPIEFEEFVYRALKLDEPDPVQAWRRQASLQKRVVDLLEKADEITIVAPGASLTVKVSGRKWISDEGKENMPGGEVFTGPHEDGVDGCVRFDFPSVYSGRFVDGAKLCFRNGEVVEYDATVGRDFLAKMLNVDDGARRVGEFAFGLNYSISRQTNILLFDEKIGGTMHIAIGQGYPETGSKNSSSIHWDMIKDLRSPEAKVYVDGDLVYEAGKFRIWNED